MTFYQFLIISERIERDTIRSVQIRSGGVYIYICMEVRVAACHIYVMWTELGHSHFLYMPAVSNVVTNGNGMDTKNVLKGTVRLGLCLVSSLLSTALLL